MSYSIERGIGVDGKPYRKVISTKEGSERSPCFVSNALQPEKSRGVSVARPATNPKSSNEAFGFSQPLFACKGSGEVSAIDAQAAESFITQMHGAGQSVCFQTFDDDKCRKEKSLTRTLHGTFKQNREQLEELNEQGAGVFFAVNKMKSAVRRVAEVTKLNALVLDLDGAPLPESWPIVPSIVVETSPGRHHVYWVVSDDYPVEAFTDSIKELARRFDGDINFTSGGAAVICRVPGFKNMKPRGSPTVVSDTGFKVRVLESNVVPPITYSEFVEKFEVSIVNTTPGVLGRTSDIALRELCRPNLNEHEFEIIAQAAMATELAEYKDYSTFLARISTLCGTPYEEQAIRLAHAACSRNESWNYDPDDLNDRITTFDSSQTNPWKIVKSAIDSGVYSLPTQLHPDVHIPSYVMKLANMECVSPTLIDGGLGKYVVNERLEELKLKMLTDMFVLARIAILGQLTVLFGSPNSGKTLVTLKLIFEAVERGDIDSRDIYYINADDSYDGALAKIECLSAVGIQCILPNQNGFEISHFLQELGEMAKNGLARGKVVIIDTIKKVTDLMDKSKNSRDNNILREFVVAGGTVIALAHVNKHKGSDGKSIPAGTSDLIDDADCAFTIDVLGELDGVRTIEFCNKKQRGAVSRSVKIAYDSSEGLSWFDRFQSVREVGESEAEAARIAKVLDDSLQRHAEIVDVISTILAGGSFQKTELAKLAVDSCSGQGVQCGVNKVRAIIDRHSGEDYAQGHRWRTIGGGKHNIQMVELLAVDEWGAGWL